MNNTNNISARQSYENAKALYYNAWIGSFGGDAKACWDYVNSRKLSQSEIRLEVNLTTNASIFSFGLTPNQTNTSNVVFPTENRLNLQDSLVACEYGIFVAQATGNTDTGFEIHTYGNTQAFAAADVAALNGTFYSNGAFQVKVNNDVVAPYRGILNHKYIPQTQATAAPGAGSPQDQYRGAEDGFITAEPNLLLIGSKNYVPQIVLPGNMPSAAANLRCILIFRGILAQNSTVVN